VKRGIRIASRLREDGGINLKSHACLYHRDATSGKLERWPLRCRRKDFDLPNRAELHR
jgi:hypothetical protein